VRGAGIAILDSVAMPMINRKRLAVVLAAGGIVGLSVASRNALAHGGEAEAATTVAQVTAPAPSPPATAPAAAPPPAAAPAPAPAATAPTEEQHPIPPNIEGPAVQAQGGGYCYGGPHPAPGGGWEAVQNPHTHNYAPFDLRLFALREGCYYFIGDARDFGYTGQTYSYYGAHPIHDHYGGGWCFMVGGHYHWWRPWSPYFTVVGPWYYWYGPYSPFFWSYWPYYSYYYRSYYPSYYAGGRYYNGYRVAPSITRVPPTGWRGPAMARPGGGIGSGMPATPGAPGGSWRGSGAAPAAGAPGYQGGPGGGWRGSTPGAGTPGYQGAPATGGGWRGGGTPGAGAPAWQGGAPSGGWGGGYRGGAPSGGWGGGAPSGGGWRGGAPSGGGFRGGFGGGGTFRGGGGGGTFRGGGGGGWRR
jgi:hypothetical protein